MPRTYVDNAMNRSLGRVGMAVGSMPVSKGSSSSYSSGGDGYRGSSRHDSGYSQSSHSSRTYVDNAMNRSLGRVGEPVGSMSSDKYGDKSSYSYGRRDSSRNESIQDYVFQSQRHEQSTYVDNKMNRTLGRVGKPIGSMPVSRKSSHYSSSVDDGCYLDDSVFTTDTPSTSAKYVDNDINRKFGRVGMPLGSMPLSRSSSLKPENLREALRKDSGFSSVSSDVYYDTRYGSRSERDGGPRRSTASGDDVKLQTTERPSGVKTYVDNAYNRKYERVGLPVGSKVIHKHSESTTQRPNYSKPPDTATKVYKDNPLNRQLGRVGKPLGSAVFSPNTKHTEEKVYLDTRINRTLGRVGKPLGSMPIGNQSRVTKKTRDVIEKMNRKEVQDWVYDNQYMREHEIYKEQEDDLQDAMLQALHYFNRAYEEMTWKKLKPLKTMPQVLNEYQGKKIPYAELKLTSKIGSGGFGEVYFTKWKETVVATKKLKADSVSRRRLDDFVKEIMLFCQLDHANIVRFIGACVERPNLCIVMEYMEMSLFEAIHIRGDVDFSETERLNIIRDTSRGLRYLHSLDIAHRDMKTTNVLVNCVDEELEVKITDFGLSSMKNNVQTSSSCAGQIIGTPRYCAPEILLPGKRLSVEDFKKADVYSLALVIFEIVFEEEPFYNFDIYQLVRYVGIFGIAPQIPDGIKPTKAVLRAMEHSWCCEPKDRLSVASVYEIFQMQKELYAT